MILVQPAAEEGRAAACNGTVVAKAHTTHRVGSDSLVELTSDEPSLDEVRRGTAAVSGHKRCSLLFDAHEQCNRSRMSDCFLKDQPH